MVMPLVQHVMWLDQMKKVGATFRLNDLTKREWDCLIVLESAKSEVEQEHMQREKEKSENKSRMSQPRER